MGESYRVEPAKTDRSTCKASKEKIDKGELRFGSLMEIGGHGSYTWRKLGYITPKQAENVEGKVGGPEGVDGYDDLTPKQQEEFKKAFAAAKAGTSVAAKAKAKAKAAAAEAKAKAKAAKAKAKATGKAASKAKAKPKATAKDKPATMPSEAEQHAFLDAAKNRDFDRVRELVEANVAYVNVNPGGRWTALHQAAEAGNAAVVKYLLGKGANIDLKTKDGKTPKDVAKASCVALLEKPSAKRKKPTEGGSEAKAAKTEGGGGEPVLYIVEHTSPAELASDQGWSWKDDLEIVEEETEWQDIEGAPAVAREVAKDIHKALDGATLPAGESDCDGRVVVITNPGEDLKETCLKALGITQEVEDENLWDLANVEDQDWNEHLEIGFAHTAEDECEEEDGDVIKMAAATKIMASKLEKHFKLNFAEEVIVAPVLFGGVASDGSVVAVLAYRVWT